MISPIRAANIDEVSTAPAAASLAFFAIGSMSFVARLTTLSTAGLINSVTITIAMEMTSTVHSMALTENKNPAATTRVAAKQ